MTRTDHRPYPPPPGPGVMAQTWHDLLFAHWPLAADELRRAIPPVLEVDTYEGQAWIAVVPFWMSGVRLRGLPSAPWLSTFPELNVRTYVTAGGKPGVYFFSLDAGNPVAVTLARRWYHLPYFHARMTVRRHGEVFHYSSHRTHRHAPPARFIGRYRPAGEVFSAEPGSLVDWLTARYCLYAVDSRQCVQWADIHHAPWPLQRGELEIEANTMVEALGLALPDTPPLLHFARRLDVVAWAPEQVR